MCNLCEISLGFGSMFTSCMDFIFGKVTNVWNLEDNLDALQKELEDLTQAKEDVKTKIDLAEKQQMRRLNQVQLWLTRVEQVETQVGELQGVRSQEIEELCLGGFCSKNPNSSCKFGEKVALTLKAVEDLKAEGAAFVDVAERIPDDPVDERPSEPTVGLESKLEEVWRYIGEEQVKIIGLYGKGGVEKTTLLTQINNKFLSSSNRFVVIWVTVSQDLRLENIQETIGKKIGLGDEEWNKKPFEEKALDIFRVLSRKKFVLLLDDIWERVDLIKIGIPPPSQEIDFKVVFTTRSLEVCRGMESHKKVEVECLTHAEAWELFQRKVGDETLKSHPDIPTLAKEVATECGGLPIALITIGRAMAGKNQLEEWEYDISILRKSAHKFSGMENEVYCLPKFSYDLLPSDIHRSCFLYCSLFPEDYNINKQDLIDCWISEGFLNECDGILARKFGYSIIGCLRRACLLEEGVIDHFVKMHDVIRDMALWIACELNEEEKFFVRCGAGLRRAPEVGELENVRRISLMENKIDELSETPYFPKLLTLFLHQNLFKMLASGFFQHMPHLKVLNLSRTPLIELPVGISELVELQHLNLSYTHIEALPKELKALKILTCLNLEFTFYLHEIPQHVISNLSMLQVLKMYRCGKPVSIKELVCLKHLNVLSISFKSSRTLQIFLNSPGLQNYSVESVSLDLMDDSRSLNVLSLRVLNDLHTLFIHCRDLVELAIDLEMPNLTQFHSLHKVQLFKCSKLRDLTWLIFAPKLKILQVAFCNDMKEIISFGDEVPEKMRNLLPFARLELISLETLPKLETIYCNPLPFPHLKKIFINGCPKLMRLPLGSNSRTNRALKIRGQQDWWNELQWEDQATQNHFLPFFQAFDC